MPDHDHPKSCVKKKKASSKLDFEFSNDEEE
jgi:hypothetical protein